MRILVPAESLHNSFPKCPCPVPLSHLQECHKGFRLENLQVRSRQPAAAACLPRPRITPSLEAEAGT